MNSDYRNGLVQFFREHNFVIDHVTRTAKFERVQPWLLKPRWPALGRQERP